jgi:hypothetical protein
MDAPRIAHAKRGRLTGNFAADRGLVQAVRTGGQFVPGSAASPQPLDDTRSFTMPTDSPADADDAKNIRFLRRVTLAPDGSLIPDPLPAWDQPQSAQPSNLLSGKPMPNYPVPPMLLGFSDRSAASGGNMDDWFNRWIKPLMEQ